MRKISLRDFIEEQLASEERVWLWWAIIILFFVL